jgi:Na+/melibiose symporter-like transporter
MIHTVLFLSAFATVFLLGIQQQNVQGRHYLAACVTSVGIGIAQIFLWRLVPDADAGQIIATLAGGPVGIVVAMWAHPRIAKQWSRA